MIKNNATQKIENEIWNINIRRPSRKGKFSALYGKPKLTEKDLFLIPVGVNKGATKERALLLIK